MSLLYVPSVPLADAQLGPPDNHFDEVLFESASADMKLKGVLDTCF
jgi:hypothetical protein